jgi:hypothetical protein
VEGAVEAAVAAAGEAVSDGSSLGSGAFSGAGLEGRGAGEPGERVGVVAAAGVGPRDGGAGGGDRPDAGQVEQGGGAGVQQVAEGAFVAAGLAGEGEQPGGVGGGLFAADPVVDRFCGRRGADGQRAQRALPAPGQFPAPLQVGRVPGGEQREQRVPGRGGLVDQQVAGAEQNPQRLPGTVRARGG